MTEKSTRMVVLSLSFILAAMVSMGWAAEPKIQILSPKDGSQIAEDQKTILISGKVASDNSRSANVDIFLILDTSGSTVNSAGAEFANQAELPDKYLFGGAPSLQPQISISRRGMGMGAPTFEPTRINLRHSILGAEVVASRRLLTQLNPQTTRVGVITFAKEGRLAQQLTNDFEQVRRVLDEVYWAGPNGGTNMVEGIRLGITELLGLGQSAKRQDAIKAQFFLTDGLPSLPTGDGRGVAETDVQLTVNAARLAGRAGIKIHVFGLGDEVVNFPWAVQGIAKESAGTYTPLSRPADVLAIMDQISVVGVDFVQIVNQTSGQKAANLRLAADGFFAAALPVVEGKNQIDVLARSSDGSNSRASISVFYQSGTQKSLDLEIFLEREKKLRLEVERLGRTPEEIQRDVERQRQEGLRRPQQLPTPTEGAPR
ncbi:MAG: VWA domain-containing protein [Candidatus Binatia bacterium]